MHRLLSDISACVTCMQRGPRQSFTNNTNPAKESCDKLTVNKALLKNSWFVCLVSVGVFPTLVSLSPRPLSPAAPPCRVSRGAVFLDCPYPEFPAEGPSPECLQSVPEKSRMVFLECPSPRVPRNRFTLSTAEADGAFMIALIITDTILWFLIIIIVNYTPKPYSNCYHSPRAVSCLVRLVSLSGAQKGREASAAEPWRWM